MEQVARRLIESFLSCDLEPREESPSAAGLILLNKHGMKLDWDQTQPLRPARGQFDGSKSFCFYHLIVFGFLLVHWTCQWIDLLET